MGIREIFLGVFVSQQTFCSKNRETSNKKAVRKAAISIGFTMLEIACSALFAQGSNYVVQKTNSTWVHVFFKPIIVLTGKVPVIPLTLLFHGSFCTYQAFRYRAVVDYSGNDDVDRIKFSHQISTLACAILLGISIWGNIAGSIAKFAFYIVKRGSCSVKVNQVVSAVKPVFTFILPWQAKVS